MTAMIPTMTQVDVLTELEVVVVVVDVPVDVLVLFAGLELPGAPWVVLVLLFVVLLSNIATYCMLSYPFKRLAVPFVPQLARR